MLAKHMAEEAQNSYLVPISIVIAGAIVAGSIYFSGGLGRETANVLNSGSVDSATGIRDVSAEEHIFGNPNAPVIVVEYSDLECPFCKTFHQTMLRIMDEYGNDGRVAWVYRHFPIDSIHPKARKEAEATECVTELGGQEKFWQYTGRIFEVTPSNNRLELDMLSTLAVEVGIDKTAFEACLSSGTHAKAVNDDFEDGRKAGITGTPSSLVLTRGGVPTPIEGALPYEQVKELIEAQLKKAN